jgi:bifunctional DNA-binding transcriptional regulator/antitoxin component of YhaV-PrlF toxin-antitoxin module
MREFTITMTSKGQFTMPIEVREALGVSKSSNKLIMTLDAQNKKAKIERPVSFDQLSTRARQYIKPGTPPLVDPRAFYESREVKK